MKYRTILFDGRNTLYRAHHVSKPLLVDLPGRGNTLIGGVYQFLRIVLSTVEQHGEPGCSIVIAWEGDDDVSWRRELFPAYQANRDPQRYEKGEGRDFIAQETILKEALSDLGWLQTWAPGCDADDALATMAARLRATLGRTPIAIVTGDRDLHQCVTPSVHVLDREVWTPEKVREKWGIPPERIPEWKALAGDKSDGVPGVDGIGPKGAKEILDRWPSLDVAFDAIGVMRDGERTSTIRKLARAGYAQVRLYRTLTRCRTDAELEFAPRRRIGASAVFSRYKFASLLDPRTIRAAENLAR